MKLSICHMIILTHVFFFFFFLIPVTEKPGLLSDNKFDKIM